MCELSATTAVILTLEEPSKVVEPVTEPVRAIDLDVANLTAVSTDPAITPVVAIVILFRTSSYTTLTLAPGTISSRSAVLTDILWELPSPILKVCVCANGFLLSVSLESLPITTWVDWASPIVGTFFVDAVP